MDWKKILFSFNGRVSRKVYWIMMVAGFALGFIFGLSFSPTPEQIEAGTMPGMSPIFMLLLIPMVWIGLAIQVKRFHDQGRSGWFVLLGFIPLIGGIIVLVMCGFLPGDPGPNEYGDGPMA